MNEGGDGTLDKFSGASGTVLADTWTNLDDLWWCLQRRICDNVLRLIPE